MRVLVFEQWRGGHYDNYLSALVPRACEIAEEVVLATCGAPVYSDRFQRNLQHLSQLPNLTMDYGVPEEDPELPAYSRLKLLSNLIQAIHRVRPDYVLVPSGDAQTLALGWIAPVVKKLALPVPSETILHYGRGRQSSEGGIAERMKSFVYRKSFAGSSWRRMGFVNCLQYEAYRPLPWGGRVAMIPDPLPTIELLDHRAARSLLGLPESGRMVGFVGIMDDRKAIPELLAAFRAAKLGDDDRLLLAGEMDAPLAQLIDSRYADLRASGRLIVMDRWLSDRELMAGFSALDLVCLPYYDFPGLSSLMLKAVALRRPVLVNDCGWKRAMVRRFDLGNFTDIRDIPGFAAEMRRSLDRSMDYRPTEGTLKLIEYHAQENFTEHAVEGLRMFAGRLSKERLLRWEEVLQSLPPEKRRLL